MNADLTFSAAPLLRDFADGRPDDGLALRVLRRWHGQDLGFTNCAAEILIGGKQRVRTNLAVSAAEFLLDAVHGMEESPAVDIQAPATQLPVGAKQKMEPEQTELLFRQHPFGDQIKVRHVIFAGAGPCAVHVVAVTRHQGDFAAIGFVGDAKIKPPQTRPKNIAQHAIAGRVAFAVLART